MSKVKFVLWSIILVTICFSALAWHAHASSTDGTIDPTNKFAWGNNLGWINFGTAGGNVHVTQTGLTGYIWSANYGWINLAPAHAGVTNTCTGSLSGYAWGQNVGYVNFSGVSINSSGKFAGTAAVTGGASFNGGTGLGSISFDCADCNVTTDWRYCTSGGGGGGGSGGSGGGGGGGSGGGSASPSGPPVVNTGVDMSGSAYPLSTVVVLKDGQIGAQTIAGPDGNFFISFSGLAGGSYSFSVYGQDDAGRKSTPFTFPVIIPIGTTVHITGIFLSPTIDVDKDVVRKGDPITIFGKAVPNTAVTIQLHSGSPLFLNATSNSSGAYLYQYNTGSLDFGSHTAKSSAAAGNLVSAYSNTRGFTVGAQNVPAVVTGNCPAKGDLNGDCRVNLVDFSVLAYWYGRPDPPVKYRLAGDVTISLRDFSIMAYYWTG